MIFIMINIFPLLFVFIIGASIGSFINVCIYRIPKGLSIVFPPSSCPGCGKMIAKTDLLPIISYILLNGKCRECSAKISSRYPVVEFLCGILFLISYFSFGLSVNFVAISGLFSILLAMTFIDLDHQIIPDGLIITGCVIGIIYGISKWNLPGSILGSAVGGLSMLTIYYLGTAIFKKEALGGGDIKLAAMLGLFLGWQLTLLSVYFSFVLGAIGSLYFLATKQKNITQEIPFGPYMALACLITVLWGQQLLKWYFSGILGY